MSEDKYLVCKDCGNEFLFSASEKTFTKKKVLRTNRVVAPAAEEHANRNVMVTAIPVAEKTAKCSVPFVLPVVKRQPYHLNQLATDQCTAGIASRPDGKFPNIIPELEKGLVFNTNPFFRKMKV